MASRQQRDAKIGELLFLTIALIFLAEASHGFRGRVGSARTSSPRASAGCRVDISHEAKQYGVALYWRLSPEECASTAEAEVRGQRCNERLLEDL